MTKLRATKIVATIGPATASLENLEAIIKAGVNVVRMNFSHDTFEFHQNNIRIVREINEKLNKHTAILVDLQGPKIRISKFKDGFIILAKGDEFTLDITKEDEGDQISVGVDYKDLAKDCRDGDTLLLDDGNIELYIKKIKGHKIITEVVYGGKLSDRKGVNRKGGGLTAPAITEKDRETIKMAALLEADFLAVSFVRSDKEMDLVRNIAQSCDGFAPKLISKIERAEIFEQPETLDRIILASDGVMVARGDLGIEVGASELVGLQKHIIKRSIQLNRFVITATQMMESMINNPLPTRAEISDVGNAVLDATDAVMLSAESAVGKYPAQTVEYLVHICQGNEKHINLVNQYKRFDSKISNTNQMISASVMNIASTLENVGAIVCLTDSGATANWLSRFSSSVPIIGITRNAKTARYMSVLKNVHPVIIEYQNLEDFISNALPEVIKRLSADNLISADQRVVLSHSYPHPNGSTNSLSVHEVSEILRLLNK